MRARKLHYAKKRIFVEERHCYDKLAGTGTKRFWRAAGACLQVVATTIPAIKLYKSMGFAHELYRYHYRVL